MTDAHPKLTRLRAQISKLAEDIEGLREGVRPESEALAAVDPHIQQMAESVRIQPFAFAHTPGGGNPVYRCIRKTATCMPASSSPTSSGPASTMKSRRSTRAA